MELAPIDDLQMWPDNYRRGDIQAIRRSFIRFGFLGALKVKNGTVYSGNHSLCALRELRDEGFARPRGIDCDPSGGWLVPCISIDHLSEDEAVAFAIADNRTAELGSTDDERLAILLGELASTTDLLASTGYAEIDLDRLLESLRAPDTSIDGARDPDPPSLDTEAGLATCPACGERFKP